MISAAALYRKAQCDYPENLRSVVALIRKDIGSKDVRFKMLDECEDPASVILEAKQVIRKSRWRNICKYVFSDRYTLQDLVDLVGYKSIQDAQREFQSACYFLAYHIKGIFDEKEMGYIENKSCHISVRSMPICIEGIIALEKQGILTLEMAYNRIKEDGKKIDSSIDAWCKENSMPAEVATNLKSFIKDCKDLPVKEQPKPIVKQVKEPVKKEEKTEKTDDSTSESVVNEKPVFVILKKSEGYYSGVIISNESMNAENVIMETSQLENYQVVESPVNVVSCCCKDDVLLDDFKGISDKFKESLKSRECNSIFDIPKKVNHTELFELGSICEVLQVVFELSYRGITSKDWDSMNKIVLPVKFDEDGKGKPTEFKTLEELNNSTFPKEFGEYVRGKANFACYEDKDLLNLYEEYLRSKRKRNDMNTIDLNDVKYFVFTDYRQKYPKVCAGIIPFIEYHSDLVFEQGVKYDRECSIIFNEFIYYVCKMDKLSTDKVRFEEFCYNILTEGLLDLHDACLFYKNVEYKLFSMDLLVYVYMNMKANVKYIFSRGKTPDLSETEVDVHSRIAEVLRKLGCVTNTGLDNNMTVIAANRCRSNNISMNWALANLKKCKTREEAEMLIMYFNMDYDKYVTCKKNFTKSWNNIVELYKSEREDMYK